MGHQNAARALLVQCTPRAKLVLVTMALHSLDPGAKRGEPLHYFGGWQVLAMSLGFEDYGITAKSAVARAVAELVDKGLVKPVDRTSSGTPVYHLSGLA
jgi:hypothetical protein